APPAEARSHWTASSSRRLRRWKLRTTGTGRVPVRKRMRLWGRRWARRQREGC
ncbi:hypothetical protein LTR66_010780, partial [Elasticomyces elasticus]